MTKQNETSVVKPSSASLIALGVRAFVNEQRTNENVQVMLHNAGKSAWQVFCYAVYHGEQPTAYAKAMGTGVVADMQTRDKDVAKLPRDAAQRINRYKNALLRGLAADYAFVNTDGSWCSCKDVELNTPTLSGKAPSKRAPTLPKGKQTVKGKVQSAPQVDSVDTSTVSTMAHPAISEASIETVLTFLSLSDSAEFRARHASQIDKVTAMLAGDIEKAKSLTRAAVLAKGIQAKMNADAAKVKTARVRADAKALKSEAHATL